jgi:O-6-methylguanine DNA methyltransferase
MENSLEGKPEWCARGVASAVGRVPSDQITFTCETFFGVATVRVTPVGIYSLIITEAARETPPTVTKEENPHSPLPHTVDLVETITQRLKGGHDLTDLPLDMHGSDFQHLVWSYVRTIPRGKTASYAEVAHAIGRPTSIRAVARACACNTIALAIPCHRVVRSDGSLGGYRWGEKLKKRLLAAESLPFQGDNR